MILKYHPEASSELDEAFEWYENEQAGLGDKFIAEVETAILRIQHFPQVNPIILKNIRRALLPGFPYGVIQLRMESSKSTPYPICIEDRFIGKNGVKNAGDKIKSR